MRNPIAIEDIQGMRLRRGIDDVALREEIQALRRGDLVKLTLLPDTEPEHGETVMVRITRVGAGSFRGKLAGRPASAALADLPEGCSLAFTIAHIHSIAKGRPPHDR